LAGVNVKMGVSGVSDFKREINRSKEVVKTLTETLKLNEQQLKETGDKEVYMANKSTLLKRKLAAQQEVVEKTEAALKAMKENGVDVTSTAFQTMQQQAMDAQTKLSEIRTEMKNVKGDAGEAKDGTEKMNKALKKIGDGVAWDNVTKGIENITRKLKSGARAAVQFGKKIVNSAKESAKWADDLLTDSETKEIDVETLQRMEKVSAFVDTEVDAIINAKKRMTKAVKTAGGKQTLEETLGLTLEGNNPEDLFWEVGEALLGMSDAFDKEEAAQKMFGRSWDDLLPLFKTGREEYEKMLAEQTVLTEEQVRKLGQADDAINKVEQQIDLLKKQLWAEHIDKLTGLMNWLLENDDAVYDALKVIAAGIGLLKLGETATNIIKVVNGFKQLKGLGGGKAAADAASGAGAGASGAGAGTAAGTGGIGASGFLGIGGVAAILAGFKWASDQRNYHSEQVRGTEANLAARTAGAEAVLAEYIRAQAAMNELDWSATEADVIDIQNRIDTAYQKLQEMEGGQEALQAYSDWRQEHSYGNYDWEMPEYLEKVNELVEELNGNGESQRQSNSEMTEAAAGMKTLPEQIKWAVQSGLSNMKVIMDGESVGRVVTPAVNQNLGALVGAIGR